MKEGTNRPRTKQFVLLAGVVLGTLAILLGALILGSRKINEGKPILLTIGTPALETNALIYIAEDRGFFGKNGLNLTIKQYDSGGAAVPGLIRSEIDLAIASEFVMVVHLLQQREIRTFGSIDRFENMFVIARKDRKIGKFTDLKNRTIGLPRGTIAEFYLSRYLTLHGLNPSDVTVVNVRPDKSADALSSGDIDAGVTWHPYLDRMIDQFGGSANVWPIQSSQLTYWNIIGRADWIKVNRETIIRLLRSISQAEKYAFRREQENKTILKKRLWYNDAYIAKVWGDNQFALSLDHSLIPAMEDEARWMIKNGMTKEQEVPNFLDYIYEDGLKAVKPEAVTIIR